MRQDKVIWFAIVFSTFIYAFLVYTMFPNPQGTFEEALKQQLTLILYGLAAVTFVAALVLPGLMRTKHARLHMVLSLALFEACAIYGLLAAFIARDWRLFVPTWILGLLGMWKVFPSGENAAATTI